MRTPDQIQIRSASVYRWLMDHFGGAQHMPEKLVRHFENDVAELVEHAKGDRYERVVDHDKDEIWWSPSEGDYHYVNPGSEMEPDCDWHPLYRRVTETAGSVTS